jgi:hypothetical protein
MSSLWGRVEGFVRPLVRVASAEREAVEEERRQLNRRRVIGFSAAMACVHLVFFVVYGWLVSTPTATHVQWSRNLELVHGTMVLVALGLVLLGRRSTRLAIGEIFVVVYLAYGAAVSTNTQLTGRSVDVYLICIVTLGFAFRLHAATFTLATLGSLAALMVGVMLVQRDPQARFAAFANAAPTAFVAWVISRVQFRAFVDDVLQRRLIERQRDELVTLNQRLDRQLRERVVERSRELGLALSTMGSGRAHGDLELGTVVRDRFVIDRLLGRGGMGAVYRAHDRVLGRAVALKVLWRPKDELELQRFLREVEATADIAHPAVVRSFHVDVSEEGRLFQVQELVPGEALDRVLERSRVLSAGHAARIGSVLADALRAAHDHGVVHRDVKPGNVILTCSLPGLKLLDFGISKLKGRPRRRAETGQDVVVGTPLFMAPEQATAPEEAAEPADVYALGATLSLLLSGTRGARNVPSDTPAALEEVVARCLASDPSSRPHPAAVRDVLDQVARAAGALDLAECNRALIHPPEQTAITLEG